MNMTPYQDIIFKSRYARYRPEDGRREDWDETVQRYHDFMAERFKDKPAILEELDDAMMAVRDREVMPSMRSLMTAGQALNRDNTCGYNCAYLPVDSIDSFVEAMFILLCGTGVGFSVERMYTSLLPQVPDEFQYEMEPIVVEDSKEGWCDAYRELLHGLFNGVLRPWDVTEVRPAGAPLKTFGGRSSGPEPLVELFQYTVGLITSRHGNKLRPIHCFDLMCKVASVIVVGGVRRSAMICLFDAWSDDMLKSKSGTWWEEHPHRALANISAVMTDELCWERHFHKVWDALETSKSGEPGIFSRHAAKEKAHRVGRDPYQAFGTNPCSEIILRPRQFCNLTEIIVRPGDGRADLYRKAENAAFLGTLQAQLTYFPYLDKIHGDWKKNSEEERLLGVSMTGIMDNRDLREDHSGQRSLVLLGVQDVVWQTNESWSQYLGESPAAAATCVKPSGTVSQLCGTSSGIHPPYAQYYIRRVRFDVKDPIVKVLEASDVSLEPDVYNSGAVVASFPMRAPDIFAPTAQDLDPIRHLDLWLAFSRAYCDHKPSITVQIPEDRWKDVRDWLWAFRDEACGMAFLPAQGEHTYQQAPFEAIDEAIYQRLMEAHGGDLWIDWDLLQEEEDNTVASHEIACAGGVCEIADSIWEAEKPKEEAAA